MVIDINKKEGRLNFSKIDFNKYDYVIVGTGPSGIVLIDALLKKKKKILVEAISKKKNMKALYQKK